MNIFIDIETIPDVAGIRTLHRLPDDVADADVVAFAQQKRRAQSGGSDFMQLHLQQVVAISCCMRCCSPSHCRAGC